MSSSPRPTTIRRATTDDAQAIAEVHLRSWQWAYRGLIPDSYIDSLSIARGREVHAQRLAQEVEERTWVAEQEGEIVGFARSGQSCDPDASPGTGEIEAIYLLQEVAGTGVGHLLFAHATDDLRQRGYTDVTLWVLETNLRARDFYERHGLVADGAVKTQERRSGVVFHEVRYRRGFVS